jgi:hypothetical protein
MSADASQLLAYVNIVGRSTSPMCIPLFGLYFSVRDHAIA